MIQNRNHTSPLVTVVMPALNEEDCLLLAVNDVLTAFVRLEILGELIIVNDGSTDKTEAIADNLASSRSNVKVIHHRKPQGIGASFWEGAKGGSGDYVVLISGDGENVAYETLRYIDMMKHVDLIVPFVFNREVRTLGRNLLSKLYKTIINLTFGMLLNYMNGTVMYRRSVLVKLDLKSMGFFYQTELLIKSINAGYLYAEVPHAIRPRISGVSKAVGYKSLFNVIKSYLKMVAVVYRINNKNSSQINVIEDSITHARRLGLTNLKLISTTCCDLQDVRNKLPTDTKTPEVET